MDAFESFESNVRYYCRRWPAVFATAHGSVIRDEEGREYLDFFAGAGALSFGHNNPAFVDVVAEHLREGRLTHSLDTFTPEKRAFLETLERVILKPRQLDMVVQTVGPTGATAVEAAMQLAQRVTGRRAVVGFQGGYHGMSYRAASISESMAPRALVAHIGDFVALPFVAHVTKNDLELLESTVRDGVNGEPIGAIILEPTQGEGGARPFDPAYLQAVRKVATRYGALVIADEIQAGVGRTGPFFSHEGSNLDPDIICLSKSISGLGLPMAINLVRRSLDAWNPGEFSGTFRGNNLAFATSRAMLETYWTNSDLEKSTVEHGMTMRHALASMADAFAPGRFDVRGNGMLCGLDVNDTQLATNITTYAFERGLIVEACGRGDTVVKLLTPLTTEPDQLRTGLERLASAVEQACAN